MNDYRVAVKERMATDVVGPVFIGMVWRALISCLWFGPVGVEICSWCWSSYVSFARLDEHTPWSSMSALPSVEKMWYPWPTRMDDIRLFDRLEWSLAFTFRMLQVPALSFVLLMPYAFLHDRGGGMFVMGVGLLSWMVSTIVVTNVVTIVGGT